MKKVSNYKFLVLGSATVLLIAVWAIFLRGESLEAATVRVYDALLTGDGEAIESHLIKDEQRAYGLSKEQYGALIRSEFMPLLADWKCVDEPVKEYVADAEIYSHLYSFTTRDRRVALLRIEVCQTDAGPRLVNFVPNLVACMGSMKYAPPADLAGKAGLFYSGMEFSKRDGQRLAKFGLEGFYDPNSRTFRKWDQIALAFKAILDAKANRASNSSSQSG